jgi:hypothetical protein
MPASDPFFRYRPGSRHINDEGGDQVAQVESVVEAVGEGCEVGLGVLAELQRLVGAGQHGLEVALHRVDPLERGQVTRLERPHYLGRVDATGLGCECADQIELHAHRLAGGVERHRRHERHLVLRASARPSSSLGMADEMHEPVAPRLGAGRVLPPACLRMDKPRANTVAHKLSRIAYYMLTRGEEYVDQGRERYEEQQRQRSIPRSSAVRQCLASRSPPLLRQLDRPGIGVVSQEVNQSKA